jgi:hypothetical protein
MLEKLSFEIAESPVIYYPDGQVFQAGTHKVIHQAGNPEKVLSVMKNSYKPLYNDDFQQSVERMAEISGFKNCGYSEFDQGRIVIGHLKNNIEDFKVNGYPIDDYLVLGSSFDGRYSFFVGTTTNLLRCQNQFSRISKVQKIRHTISAPIKREELFLSLESYFSNRKKMYENFNRMSEVKVSPEVQKLVQDYIMGISEEDRLEEGKISTRKLNNLDALQRCIFSEMGDVGENMFGLFQGVTKYTTHVLNTKEKVFGNMFGTADMYNQRAYSKIVELSYA